MKACRESRRIVGDHEIGCAEQLSQCNAGSMTDAAVRVDYQQLRVRSSLRRSTGSDHAALLSIEVSSAAVGAAYEKGMLLPAELKRYADPATEFGVVRLTDPSHESWLPAYYGRIISHRGDFLLYASDRSGSMQGYRMDLKNGQSREVANDTGLLPASLRAAASAPITAPAAPPTTIPSGPTTSRARPPLPPSGGPHSPRGMRDEGHRVRRSDPAAVRPLLALRPRPGAALSAR